MDLYCFVLPQQLGILKHNPVSWDYKGGTSRKSTAAGPTRTPVLGALNMEIFQIKLYQENTAWLMAYRILRLFVRK